MAQKDTKEAAIRHKRGVIFTVHLQEKFCVGKKDLQQPDKHKVELNTVLNYINIIGGKECIWHYDI